MKGWPVVMWNFIMIYLMVSKIYRENLKLLAIICGLPVELAVHYGNIKHDYGHFEGF